MSSGIIGVQIFGINVRNHALLFQAENSFAQAGATFVVIVVQIILGLVRYLTKMQKLGGVRMEIKKKISSNEQLAYLLYHYILCFRACCLDYTH